VAQCVFCRIIKGELPCSKVYEDDRVISFLDINPVSTGHTLVVPKKHWATLFEISEEDLRACTAASKKIATAVHKATKASGLNLLQNNYRAAGQLIDHVHFHLIPRFPNDDFMRSWPAKPSYQHELARLVEKIKSELLETGRGAWERE
jgi:histidine triad (HIT) family protein